MNISGTPLGSVLVWESNKTSPLKSCLTEWLSLGPRMFAFDACVVCGIRRV